MYEQVGTLVQYIQEAKTSDKHFLEARYHLINDCFIHVRYQDKALLAIPLSVPLHQTFKAGHPYLK